MPITRFQKDTGTTLKPGPMLTVEPDLEITQTDQEKMATSADGNPAFIADTVVSFYVHENMGINLFRMLESVTQNPVLRRHFLQMIEETATASEVWEQLQANLGITPGYISPAGRATEAMDQAIIDSFLKSGSADPLTLEMAAINATFTAASMCVANVNLLKAMAQATSDDVVASAMQSAVAQLEPTANKHLDWATNARTVMATSLGKSKTAFEAATFAEEVYGRLKK